MNAFKYGWRDPKAPSSLWIGFERCSREPLEWKEELAAAARRVASEAKKPLWLAFSGGMDSEVMCRAFFDQGIQFSALTLEDVHGTNMKDVDRARDWCWKRGIPHKIVRFDMDSFLNSEIDAYIENGYVTDAVGKYLQLKVLETADSLGGYAVIGSGVLIPRVSDVIDESTEKDIYLRFNTGHTIMPEWCVKKGVEHVSNFFSSTPEACFSYFSVPALTLALENPEMLKSTAGAFIIKLMAYQTGWPDIRPRYTDFGFKHRMEQMKAVRQRIRTEYEEQLQTFDLSYPELRSQLSP
jgi:hypothetical protein